MDLFAYSFAPSYLHGLTNSTSCSVSLPYSSSLSLAPACSPSSPLSSITKPQLILFKTTQQLLAGLAALAPPPPASSSMALSSDSALCQWALVLVLLALLLSLFLSLLVSAQIAVRYSAAYWAAPREIAALLDAADASLQENESYDRDVVARVPQLGDKLRLGRMLEEIQRASDDLREDLNNVLERSHNHSQSQSHSHTQPSSAATESTGLTSAAQLDEQKQLVRRRRPTGERIPALTMPAPRSPQLKTTARLLWASRRIHIQERVRQLDMLRMRFLVVYMSIVASTTAAAADKAEKSAVVVAAAAASVSGLALAPARTVRDTTAAAVTPSKTVKLTRVAASAAPKHASSVTSSDCSSGDDSDSESGSSACSSPLMSASSMPTSPQSLPKTTASIVAASIAAAAAEALETGDTDGKYHPGSLPGSPTSPEPPNTPPGSGRSHPFLHSIAEGQQLRSPPATPGPDPASPDGFQRKPTRRVTTLGIRAPEASPENNHRAGWLGVVQELQRSPLLQKRHTSIEKQIARQSK